MKMNKVHVVVAHPDDEVLGCGGLISKLVSQGMTVTCHYLNNGYSERAGFDPKILENQIAESCRTLGVSDYIVDDFKAAWFEAVPKVEMARTIHDAIKVFQPDTVLTHDATDLHQDHISVHHAVMVACRFKPGSTVRNLLTFPVISSSDISPKWGFAPNLYADVTEHIDVKVLAMTHYTTEVESLITHRGESPIRTWGKFFGLQSNMEYAEPFRVIRASL